MTTTCDYATADAAAPDDSRRHHAFSHAAVYLVARGIPGIIAFVAIPLFTRLLDPQGYGKYALVIATVGLINALAFQWLRLALVRYLPAYKQNAATLKSTLVTLELLLSIIAGVAAAVVYFLPAAREWRGIIFPCWVLVTVQPLFELLSENSRAMIRPWTYMTLQISRAAIATALGAALIVAGLGWWGPLVGAAVGLLLPSVWCYSRDWRDVRLTIDRRTLVTIFKYGIPLSVTVALTVVISTSDRFLIAYFLSDAAAGLYSVAVDFTSQTLTLLMMVSYMAVFPLAVRAWETHGPEAAREQMRHNAALLLAVGIPSVVGITILSPGIAHVFLGESFRDAARTIIPLVAIGAFLGGYKACHLDAAFQFVHRTMYQVWIVLIAAVINIGLNLLVIRRFGINGSAVASIVSYLVALVLTAAYGRRHFSLPFPVQQFLQISAAAVIMGLLLYPLRGYRGAAPLAVQILLGAIIYLLVLFLLNFLDLRSHFLDRWSSRCGAMRPQLDSPAAVAVD